MSVLGILIFADKTKQGEYNNDRMPEVGQFHNFVCYESQFLQTKESRENTTTSTVDRSCANHKYIFPGGRSYAQALRDPVKKNKNVQNAQCPSTQQPKLAV